MPISPRLAFCVATLAALPLLSACAPDRDQFPPACPRVSFLTPTADLAEYRPGSNGRDLTALALAGRMQSIQGKCKPGDRKDTVAATVVIGVTLARGPALQGNRVTVPVFVAVTEGNAILDKHIYNLSATFPSNVERVAVSTPPVELVLPITPAKTAAAYDVLAGFQLTPDQLANNRAQ
jgi:hypothetical protein